jgi:hypothetical protein
LDRRTLLRAAAASGLALGLPEVLTGCRTYIRPAPRIPGYAIDVAPLPPGVQGLIAARAAQIGVAPESNAGLEAVADRGAAFGGLTERQQNGGFNPVYDTYPRDTDLAVVQADATLDPVVRAVMAQGVQVISYLAPLPHQTAQIDVDPGSLGELLAMHAADWARSRLAEDATAIFVSAPDSDGVRYLPLSPSVLAAERAIRATFSRVQPRLRITTVDYLEEPERALGSDPSLRIVLCANDVVALNTAQTVRHQVPRGRRDGLYVGGLGTPSIGQSGTPVGQGAGVEPWMRELARDDVLRGLATVRLSDLANSLVDLPAALIRGRRPYDIRIPPVLLTPRSRLTRDYAHESQA